MLGVLVAVVGVIALVPYLVLQLKGLGIIVATASYGAISPAVAIWMGAAVVTVYVMLSGVRGSAWNSVVKDILILVVVVFFGIYIPFYYFKGIGEMFRAIDQEKPGFLVFQPSGYSVTWFQSTVLLTVLGFFMWPHTFGSAFTARDERIFRRNAIILPLYQLILLFVFFVGFAATLRVPGLQGADIDLALFKISTQTFDPWFVGVIGAAGVLIALVPGSMILTSASTLLANDVYRGMIKRKATDASVTMLARIVVPVVALIAVLFALQDGDTIVALLLMGYSFVTQLFPALILSFSKRRLATKEGAFCGILVGVLIVAVTTALRVNLGVLLPGLPNSIKDVNIGFVALLANVLTCLFVSGITRNNLRANSLWSS